MKVLIVGCGFVGMHIATLLQNKYELVLTTKSHQNLSKLQALSLHSHLLDTLSDNNQLSKLIRGVDHIIITLAAKNREEYKQVYLGSASQISDVLRASKARPQIIYTSSTSVYGDQKGKFTDETASCENLSSEAQVLLETENTYLDLMEEGFPVCIFRLSELYGPDRSLYQKALRSSGQQIPGNRLSYTNMIHVQDVARAINFALANSINGVFNLTDDEHPIRENFYTMLADKWSLEPPYWQDNSSFFHGGNKKISNQKIKQEGFSLLHPEKDYSHEF